MFCNYCGTQNPDDAVFCIKCGKRQHPVVNEPATDITRLPIPSVAEASIGHEQPDLTNVPTDQGAPAILDRSSGQSSAQGVANAAPSAPPRAASDAPQAPPPSNEQEETNYPPKDSTPPYPADHTTPASPYNDPYPISEPITPTPNPYFYPGNEIGVPPPPPPTSYWQKQTRLSPVILWLSLVVALLLFASAGVFYLARTSAVNMPQPTPIVRFVPATATAIPTAAPTQQPTAPPTPTPTVVVETPTPTAMIVPYTASQIFQDFQAAGIAMSNVHSDNNWCPHCDYTPYGGAIGWEARGGSDNGTPTEIATFATTHALLVDEQELSQDGMNGTYVGRCLLFYKASTLSDIDAYTGVMQANCY